MVFLPNDPSRGDGGVIPIRPRPPLPNKTIGTNPGLLTSTGKY